MLHTTGEVVTKDNNNDQTHQSSVTTQHQHIGESSPDDLFLSHLLENFTIGDTEMTQVKPDQVMINQLTTQEATVSEDVDDFLDENPNDEIGNTIGDLDAIVKKTEELRSRYRSKHKELQMYLGDRCYNERYGGVYKGKLDITKQFSKEAKWRRKKLREEEDTEKRMVIQAKENTVKFLNGEVQRIISSLESVFGADVTGEVDDEIPRRKAELPDHLNEMQILTKTIKDMKMDSTGIEDNYMLDSRYEHLIQLKSTYVTMLNEEITQREIEKQKNFNKSALNIKLAKFKGYDSNYDIYTFQDEFKKLYVKSAPKCLLPDLLKNNFLENPALLLVKDVKDIEEIWKRLKDAYGDYKTMLSKKLAEFNNIEATWKHRNPAKTSEGLSKIINLMKDLMQLSKRHGTENRLFYGDGLERIYKLMGNGRMTRWLGHACDQEGGEEQWNQLIIFLEKELKVCQQKVIILSKTMDLKHTQPISSANKFYDRGQHLSHHISDGPASLDCSRQNSTTANSSCFICGESNHILTNGPGGIKLVQYFVCKKFVDMTPLERFQVLRSKGLCFQCLFPGAEWNIGKHKDGRCQRDFTCKHRSHDRYPTKKHVLVCDEHKDSQDNKDLLQEYKTRCILKQRQTQLPSHAKEIQLSHHVKPHVNKTYIYEEQKSTNKNYSFKDDDLSSLVKDSAIYMLQTIKVDDHEYSIFYDSGCGDFVSRYNAIQRLGSRATQECIGPITLRGVGGISTQSAHGIYSIKLPLGRVNEVMLTGVCMDQITETFPSYPLTGKVEADIKEAYLQAGGELKNLPALPKCVGGDTDFMLGIKYLRYFPEKIFQLPSGLTIYKSHFRNADGSFGIIGGPHKIFTEIEQQHHLCHSSFISNQYQLFHLGFHVNPDLSLLGYKEQHLDISVITQLL